MMVSNRGSLFRLLQWQQEKVVWYATAAVVVWLAYSAHWVLGLPELFSVPLGPVAVLGGAIGIFASFRTNSAYDRWWEGRKLWGRLINTSRHHATQVLSWIDDREVAEALVRRQIAYVHTLRCLLRLQDPFADFKVAAYLAPDEQASLPGRSNTTHALLHLSHGQFTRWARENGLEPQLLQQLDESTRHLLDIQGGCERIKKTPLPRGYGFMVETLIRVFAVLLPVAIVSELGVMMIPVSVTICLAFALISEAGRVLEDPFDMYWNALPLFALTRTIENDLLSRLGVDELEPLPTPDASGILM